MHQAHNKECRKQLVPGILYYVCLFLKTKDYCYTKNKITNWILFL